ncbi:hypothetical protein [Peribacillus sp. SCS-155]|uniref:hypothetical protein n=1 Tax=Peribacillus sedimenti TaxID=3115297 RepID=UPI003905D557
MRFINRQKILDEHPELPDELHEIFSHDVFVYLDLLLFSLLLGFLLYSVSHSLWKACTIPILFLAGFSLLYKSIFHKNKGTS